MLTKDNIEVFILTYNRMFFLKDAVKSLLNQSIGDVDITVMDNGSTDETEAEILEMTKFHSNLHYNKKKQNVSQSQNFLDAISLAQKDYIMIFHDDDIIHPDYLKSAISALNKYPNASIISTCYKEYSNPTNDNWKKVSKLFYYCPTKNDFVDYLCYQQKFAYCSTIYKTENLKRFLSDMPKLSQFGKMGDKPLVIESMQANDDAIILKDRHFLRYRVHAGQDTQSSGPYYNEIIEFNKYYKNYMKRNWYSYFLFSLINYKQLKSGYVWSKDYTLSLNEFIQKAIDEEAGCFYTKLCISKFGKLFIEIAHILRKLIKSNYKVCKF